MTAEATELLYSLLCSHMLDGRYAEGIDAADRLLTLTETQSDVPLEFREVMKVQDQEVLLLAFRAWCRICKKKMQQKGNQDGSSTSH